MPGPAEKRRRSWRRPVAALVLATLLSACERREPLPPGEAGSPARGGTVVVALPQEPESLLPYATHSAVAADVQSFLFRMLATTNADFGTFSPSVARDWEWSADHRELVMHLRPDVVWSDGVPLTAADVAFTHDVARDSLVGWPTRSWKRHVIACDVIDPHTVRFRFDAVFYDQFRFAKEGWLLPEHVLGGVPRSELGRHAFARVPVGCGPFVLESWEPGQRLVLVRNERYFDSPRPWLDRVVFEIVPEASTRVERLRAGSIDLCALEPRQALELQRAAAEGGTAVRVQAVRGRSYDFIAYNPAEPLFSSRAVREALTRAIDRRQIIEALCFGFAEIFEGPFPPMLWAHDPALPVTPYDPQGARRLLAAEGWRDTDGDGWLEREGRKFEFTVTTNSDNALRMQAAVPVQAYWKAIGVQAHVQGLEMQTALKRRAERRYQAYFGGWNAGLSPSGTVENLWSCTSRGSKGNCTDYCNPAVDSLNALVAASAAPESAAALTHRIQALIVADHPYTWMYYEHTLVGIGPRLQGIAVDPRGAFVNMEDWYVPAAGR